MSKKSNNVKKLFCIPTLIIAILFVIMINGNALAQIGLDETKSIDMDMYYAISLTGIAAGDILSVNVQVTKGGPVDVLLMKSTDYVDFLSASQSEEGGTFEYYVDGSSDSIMSKNYEFTFPENGDYYLVIDNTLNPIGGAEPAGTVEVNAKINVIIPTYESPGFGIVLAIFGIIFALYRRR